MRSPDPDALAHIAHYRRDADNGPISVPKRQHREFDGDNSAVFAQSPNRQRVAGAVAGLSATHGLAET
jgi:hypothetical protein